MRAKGMAYDTGFIRNGEISREHFDPEVVSRELAIIRDDLHCTAVQIVGGDPERLELAAGYAAELGLEVWFSPYPLELSTDEILSLFADCAERAERIRQRGAEIVFVAGVELSIMNQGFMPGDSVDERLGLLLRLPPDRRRERIAEVGDRVNDLLGNAVATVRERFRGQDHLRRHTDRAGRLDALRHRVRRAHQERRGRQPVPGRRTHPRRSRASRSPSPASAPPPTVARATGAPAAWRLSSTTRAPAPPSGWTAEYIRDEAGQAAIPGRGTGDL